MIVVSSVQGIGIMFSSKAEIARVAEQLLGFAEYLEQAEDHHPPYTYHLHSDGLGREEIESWLDDLKGGVSVEVARGRMSGPEGQGGGADGEVPDPSPAG